MRDVYIVRLDRGIVPGVPCLIADLRRTIRAVNKQVIYNVYVLFQFQ